MLIKNKLNKILNIVFIVYIFVFTIVSMIVSNNNIVLNSDVNNIFNLVLFFILSLLSSTFKNISVIVIFIAIKTGLKFYKIDISNDKNVNETFMYYRDILKGYSPTQLSYVYKLLTDFKNNIYTTILSLQIKNKIKIEDNKIMIIDDSNDNLFEDEIQILNKIRNNSNMYDDSINFDQLVVQEAINNNLIVDKGERNKQIVKKIGIKFLICIIVLLFSILLLSYLPNIEHPSVFLVFMSMIFIALIMLLVIFVCFYPLYAFFTICTYIIRKTISPYVRTDIGNKLFQELLALERFLKNFGLLQDKELKYINIWDEYLMYSVLFNQNEKVIEELDITLRNSNLI